jgi:hypothetical protein
MEHGNRLVLVTIIVSLWERRDFLSAAVLEIFSDDLSPIGDAVSCTHSFSGKRIYRAVGAAGDF